MASLQRIGLCDWKHHRSYGAVVVVGGGCSFAYSTTKTMGTIGPALKSSEKGQREGEFASQKQPSIGETNVHRPLERLTQVRCLPELNRGGKKEGYQSE